MPRKRTGVQPFDESEIDDEVEMVDDDEELDEGEDMAEATAKAKSRRQRAREAEEAENDEDEDVTDEVDLEVEDDDEEEEESGSGFTPWIYHENADWTLQSAFEAVDGNEDVIIYDHDNDRWYKMSTIRVGELPAEDSNS